MDNCEEQRILDMINKNKKCCRPCFGPTGPKGDRGDIGPVGETGISHEIIIDETKTINPDEPAKVQDEFNRLRAQLFGA